LSSKRKDLYLDFNFFIANNTFWNFQAAGTKDLEIYMDKKIYLEPGDKINLAAYPLSDDTKLIGTQNAPNAEDNFFQITF